MDVYTWAITENITPPPSPSKTKYLFPLALGAIILSIGILEKKK